MSAIGRARARRAPRALAVSDVGRWRGLGVATALAVTAAVAAMAFDADSALLAGAPGPLAGSHRQAGLSCEACHSSPVGVVGGSGAGASAPEAACRGCHADVQLIRDPHRGLYERGLMGCTDCHRVHVDHGGVALTRAAPAVRFGPGGRQLVSAPGVGWQGDPLRVAAVPAEACGRCHQLDASDDPIAACLLAGQEALAGARPTVCFDEHRRPGWAAAAGAAEPDEGGPVAGVRDAAWQHAREVLARAPAAPAGSGAGRSPWRWLGLSGLAGLLGFVLVRARDRQRLRGAVSTPTAQVTPPREHRLPVINTATCLGCYACVDACPYDALEVQSFVAVVARPADCCGLALCQQRCPNGSLTMGDGQPRSDALPVRASLESERVPGLYLAGDVTGLPLIRNAINQGAHAVRELAATLPRAGSSRADAARARAGASTLPGSRRGVGRASERGRRSLGGRVAEDSGAADLDSVLDLIIVGAGPAGISASLAAKACGLSYATLEQGTVADSIQRFPRGKLVFDQPLDMPMVGDLWLRESTKEELLRNWLRIVRSERLAIYEHMRVVGIDAGEDIEPDTGASVGFAVQVTQADGGVRRLCARRVLVAIGKRGEPRRLSVAVPPSMADRVHDALADAQSFAGQRVVIVGLGDVAMEAAVALSRQSGTEVVVSHRGDGFARGKARNIAALKRRVAAGAVRLALSTEVRELRDRELVLAGPGGDEVVACDALLVLIGSDTPTPFLQRIGVLG